MIYDYIILGGGCAGLSLASGFSRERLNNKTIAVLDRREQYEDDRTWCYWNTYKHRFQDVVSKRWSAWQVKHNNKEKVFNSEKYQYEYIRGKDFYDKALSQIHNNKNASLYNGCDVLAVHEDNEKVTVETSLGKFQARTVFDSRYEMNAQELAQRDDYLLQCFHGWFIETKEPVFNAKCVTLMDFNVSQEHGIYFFYILPFSDNYALIEATYFLHHPNNFSADDYADKIENYIHDHLNIASYQIKHKEHGVIPMMHLNNADKASNRIVKIGTAAGLAV